MARTMLYCIVVLVAAVSLGAIVATTPLGVAIGTTTMSEEARWALDEAEYYQGMIDAGREDLATFHRDVLPYLPGGPADYRDALAASRADIRATEDYVAALRGAAADGRITIGERADLEKYRQAAEDAEDAAYAAMMSTPAGPLIEFNSQLMGAISGALDDPAAP